MASSSPSVNPPEDVNKLVSFLSEAIRDGDENSAKDLVSHLSSLHLKLNINVVEDEDTEKEFSVKVQVEDREVTGTHFELPVKPNDTVADLKRKVWFRYSFPVETQRWIIGKKIQDDQATLQKCGVHGPGFTLYLYVVAARLVCLDQQQSVNNNSMEGGFQHFPNQPSTMVMDLSFDGQAQSSVLEGANYLGPACCPQAHIPESCLESSVQGAQDPEETKVVKVSQRPFLLNPLKREEKKKNPGWMCPRCTFINFPTRPGCEICSTSRPEDYVVPDNYQMTDEELALKARQEELERLTRQSHEMALMQNYNQWIELDDQDLIPNEEAFTCPICFDEFEPGEGIVLRECLHQFCKECLEMAVVHSEEPILKCPFQDDNLQCDSVLQEREIRALVKEDTFIKYLQRGLDQAESQAANSFHCKTEDCRGWCLYEDEVNFFDCPICNKRNCLTCKVIHEGMNCKEYQADLALKAKNNDEARKTQELIEGLVKNGTAMHCPQCKIIVQKKDGCDWIKCSVCKTQICWVTKGPRWGPKGNGDISGGCRCRVNGPCHPNCGNCH